jgi:hypothetical protein
MKLALIPPFSMLDLATPQDYQLLLPRNFRDQIYAQWAVKDILQDPEQFTILDNGLAEDQQIDDIALLAMASYYKPSELVVPDVMRERGASIDWALKFIDMKVCLDPEDYPYDGRYAFVAQGRTYHEALECAKQYIDNPLLHNFANTIMIPRHLVTAQEPHARLIVAGALYEYIGDRKVDIHLLGGSRFFPREIYYAAKDYPFIRGMDTSMPFVFGMQGVHVDEVAVGPLHRETDETYWTHRFTEYRAAIARHNVQMMRRWIGDVT